MFQWILVRVILHVITLLEVSLRVWQTSNAVISCLCTICMYLYALDILHYPIHSTKFLIEYKKTQLKFHS